MPKDANQRNVALLKIYAFYRIALGALLASMYLLGVAPKILGTLQPDLFLFTTGAYTCLNLAVLAILWKQKFHSSSEQLFFLLLIDIVVLVLVSHASGGVGSGINPLLMATTAISGILLNLRASSALAATATILLLIETLAGEASAQADSRALFSTGILGFMLFTLAVAFSYLSSRLRATSISVAEQQANIRHLQDLAQLIIERMQTGVVVCNPKGDVQLINQSAVDLLGWEAPKSQRRLSHLPELEEYLSLWQNYPESRTPNLKVPATGAEARIRFSNLLQEASPPSTSSNILIYVEDARALTREAQNLKLASLGRLTASIAHEIRNPLGAISHAAQLLAESDQLIDGDRRLADIVENNCERVNQIIENVLQLSRRQAAKPEITDLAAWLPEFVREYRELDGNRPEINVELDDSPIRTRIDISHLQQILTNLLDNGLRHSLKSIGEAKATLAAGTNTQTDLAWLQVIDQGEGISEDNIALIFEPFFTTEVSGSGLGLYLCKELCESNNAVISYQRTDGKSCFRIDFAHPERVF